MIGARVFLFFLMSFASLGILADQHPPRISKLKVKKSTAVCGCQEVVCLEKREGYYQNRRVRYLCRVHTLKTNRSVAVLVEPNLNVREHNFDCEKTPSKGNMCARGTHFSRSCGKYQKTKKVVVFKDHCDPINLW